MSESLERPQARTTFAQDFRRFFLRGLALILPPILTVLILLYFWDLLQRKVGEPTNVLIRKVAAWTLTRPPWFVYEWRATKPAGEQEEWVGLGREPRSGVERGPFVPRTAYQFVSENTPTTERVPNNVVGFYEKYLLYEYWKPYPLSFIGLVVAVVFVYFIGHFLATFIGHSLWRATEQTVFRLPIVRAVYPTVKEVSDFLLSDSKRQYNRVVAVEYPRRGIWSLGFVTGDAIGDLERAIGQELLTVFIPYTPYSVTGYIITVPRSEVLDLNVSVEDSIRFIMSGGLYRPGTTSSTLTDNRKGPSGGRSLGRASPRVQSRYIRVGTRGSKLARTQADWVADRLRELLPDRTVELVEIRTGGDRQPDARLRDVAGEGIFTKEIQSALLAGEVDVAVHSLKDLPTTAVPGIALAAVPRRAPALDVLVSPRWKDLRSLPPGARIGTSSPRRRSQLLRLRSDLVIEEIRGNVPTRVRKIDELRLSGIVLAHAGLHRLGMEDQITYRFTADEMLPSPGQGALGIECRAEDRETIELLSWLDDLATRQATLAERTVLAALGGGCHMALGAYATVADEQLGLRAGVFSPDGSQSQIESIAGMAAQAESLGQALAERLRSASLSFTEPIEPAHRDS